LSQALILNPREKPTPEALEEWNQPIGGESKVDYIWTDKYGTRYHVKLPYWVKFAIDVDYVRPGYALQDYLNGAINGFPTREGDPEDVKKAGFNLVAVCNEMGLGKCVAGETEVFTPAGYRPIRDLVPGDAVLSRKGWGTVLQVIRSSRPLLEVKTESKTIYSSPEHKFWTQFGWVPAKDLTSNHKLLHLATADGEACKMDFRGKDSAETDVRFWRDQRESSRSFGKVAIRSLGHEIQARNQESHLAVCLSASKSDLATATHGVRPCLSSRNRGRRRDDHDYQRGFFQIPHVETSADNFQHFSGAFRLDSEIRQGDGHTGLERVWRHGDADSHTWSEGGRISQGDASLLDHQKDSGIHGSEVLRVSDGTDSRYAIYQGSDGDILGCPNVEPRFEKVLRIEAAASEERLYDLATSTGEYVAEGLLVHNSNLCMQLGGQVYGEEKAGEWYPDWDLVLKYKILRRDQIIPLWKQAREQGRIKFLLLDDLDSIFSKELWFEDRPLYIKLRKAVNLIRPRVANFCVSAPSLNDVISILNTKITFEVMPFPNMTYMVERYCRFVDQFSSTSNFFRKIMTEYSKFMLKDVPSEVWKSYDADRELKEEEEMEELEKAMTKTKHRDMTLDESQKKKGSCPKCGYTWTLRGDMVARCPRCHTSLR
jgi:predicted Zn-ribbon and HTH transcriptional regulator